MELITIDNRIIFEDENHYYRYEEIIRLGNNGLKIAVIGQNPAFYSCSGNTYVNKIINELNNYYDEEIHLIGFFNLFARISNDIKIDNWKNYDLLIPNEENNNLIYLNRYLINYDIIYLAYGQHFTKYTKKIDWSNRLFEVINILRNINKPVKCFGLLNSYDKIANNHFPINMSPKYINLNNININIQSYHY